MTGYLYIMEFCRKFVNVWGQKLDLRSLCLQKNVIQIHLRSVLQTTSYIRDIRRR
jgi:hypothetical protein